MAPLTVYPSKRKLALLTVASFAFVVGGIFIIRDASVPLVLKVLGGYSGIVFFGMCLAYGLYRLMRPVPMLVISEQGLFDNASAAGAGWFKWSEIKDESISSEANRDLIPGWSSQSSSLRWSRGA